MTQFAVLLHLFLANGSSVDVPLDKWVFASKDACAQSIALLNTGLDPAKRQYACVEQSVHPKVAIAEKHRTQRRG
jgi:hypothetical protein